MRTRFRQWPQFGYFLHFSVVGALVSSANGQVNAAPTISEQEHEQSHLEDLRKYPLSFVCGWRGKVHGYFPMHSHQVIELVYHPRGSGVTSLEDGRKIEFEPHGTVIYPAFVRHDQRMFVSGDDICIHVQEANPTPAEKLFPEAIYIPPSRTETQRADAFVRTEFLHLARVRSDATRRLELCFRVTALVARLLQLKQSVAREIPQASPEIYVDRARRYVAENYAKIGSVDEIARHVGVSKDYLRHLFAERSGTSLNRLLNLTRIERVKELLIHSRLPLKAIAALVGFETERYLSTRFKQHTGVSPGTYRSQSTDRKYP